MLVFVCFAPETFELNFELNPLVSRSTSGFSRDAHTWNLSLQINHANQWRFIKKFVSILIRVWLLPKPINLFTWHGLPFESNDDSLKAFHSDKPLFDVPGISLSLIGNVVIYKHAPKKHFPIRKADSWCRKPADGVFEFAETKLQRTRSMRRFDLYERFMRSLIGTTRCARTAGTSHHRKNVRCRKFDCCLSWKI